MLMCIENEGFLFSYHSGGLYLISLPELHEVGTRLSGLKHFLNVYVSYFFRSGRVVVCLQHSTRYVYDLPLNTLLAGCLVVKHDRRVAVNRIRINDHIVSR